MRVGVGATFTTMALVATLLTGCPKPPSDTQAGALKLQYDPPSAGGLAVGSTVQLRLSFGGSGEYMMAALIDPPSERATRWYSDPPDAVQFDTARATVRLVKPGKVRIWASYTQADKETISNHLELVIGPEDVAPVETGTPAAPAD